MRVTKHFFSNKLYNACWKLKRLFSNKYYSVRNRMRLNSTGVIYEKDIVTSGKLIISNCGKMQIGKGVVINSGCYPNPVGYSDSRLYTERADSVLEIGDNTGMSNVMIYAASKISIGCGVMIGAETVIMDTDFHSPDLIITGTNDRGTATPKPIKIKDNAFIGTKCIILKGVSIGKGSVIGAGSVVAHDVPENEIWAGNPAKFIRKIQH